TIADGADPGAVAEMIGAQLAQLLDPHAPPLAPLATEVMLSMAHAALLSARTGQPECPATIRRMG
ncbi:MAG: hypothetical protein KDA21_07645, partial [Phycisphaerales bacterium]|nr:hypothetical protein [Phycisphaerales bacterium]